MPEPAISFMAAVYDPMRAQGICLPDDQVIDMVRHPDYCEPLTRHGDKLIQLRAAGGSCGVVDTFVLVLSADSSSAVDVFFSIIVPAYLRDFVDVRTAVGVLRAFAMRFGVPIRSRDQVGWLLIDAPADAPLQVVDDGTTSFLMLTSPPTGGSATVPFALAIDLDRYTQWLVQACPDARKENVRIELLPQLRPHISGWRLLDTSGICAMGFERVEDLAQTTLSAFSVTAPTFSLKAGLEKGVAYLERNGSRVEAALVGLATGRSGVVWHWNSTQLLVATNNAGPQRLKTEPTIPPRSLIRWARANTYRVIATYSDASKLCASVNDMLSATIDKIAYTGMQAAFWDIQRSGNAITGRKPKLEPEVHKVIQALFFEHAMVKNIAVTGEPRAGAGRIDFVFRGQLSAGETIPICAEFKNAHSDDLEHGLKKQLLDYMSSEGTDYGIYCVLYYDWDDFKAPMSREALEDTLNTWKMEIGAKNIHVLVWDLSKPRPPSAA